MRGHPNQILLRPPPPKARAGPGSKALEARGRGLRLHSYCQSNVAARGRGLDCIVIAKVMWQQGARV